MNLMHKALQLAAEGRFLAAPNPMVGCVIELNGEIVGSGWHKGVGFPHAEVVALNMAGDKAFDANVYVNLEPCCHYGRTPPCVDALIKAKVKSVHIPFIDPNPLVNGQSVIKLKAHGIDVYVGEEEAMARKLNEVFLHYIATKRPFVIAKWAMSLDGKLATKTGDARWISNEKSRRKVHELRHEVAAILIGANTIIADDPQLTVRNVKATRQPLRIILDGSGRIPLTARVLLSGETLVVTTTKSSKTWREKLGNKVLILPEDENGKVDINLLLDELGQREISSLLVEGGAEVLRSFFAAQLINKFQIYIAPKIIGDIDKMEDVINLTGDDVLITAEPKICLPE